MTSGRVTVKDHGADRLLRNLTGLAIRAHVLDVGVIGSKADKEHRGGDGVTVADVATWAEYGIGQPERPWLRGYIEAHRGEIEERIRLEARRVVTHLATRDEVLARLGVWLQGEIQAWIADPGNDLAPNAPETIIRKGSAMPLIDTGQLRSSITHAVRTPDEGG